MRRIVLIKEISNMVEVFITNVHEPSKAEKVFRVLKNEFSDLKMTFDLDDRHKILRVEGNEINQENIISIINNLGFNCTVLEDKVCK